MTYIEYGPSHTQSVHSSENMHLRNLERRRLYAFEKLPTDAIDDITINPAFQATNPDPRLEKYLQADSLIRHAGFIGINRSEGSIFLPQPPTMYRGVVYEYASGEPFVDEYGNCYSQVSGKGTGVTSETIDVWTQESGYFAFDPVGLFGRSDAEREMEVSNHIAHAGGRTGRVLGILTLNHDKLTEWFRSFPNDVRILYHLEDQLSEVYENGDTAAICIRLLGAERIEDFRKIKRFNTSSLSSPLDLFSLTSMTARTASLLLSEIDMRGEEEFVNRYGIPENLNLTQVLGNFMNGSYTEDDVQTFILLNQAFFAHNLSTTTEVSSELYEGTLAADYREHNIDLAGFWYDWELSFGKNQKYNDMSEVMIRELFPLSNNS